MTILYDSTTTYDSAIVYEGGSTGVGLIFTPPLIKDRPTFLEDSSQDQKDLWRHYENRYRGVNVWILSDGNVVQDTTTPENSNTDMSAVYPWNPNNPSAPYVRSIYIDAGVRPQVASVHTVSHAVYPVAYFAGASSYLITQPQATLLADYTTHGIGYSDCLTPET